MEATQIALPDKPQIIVPHHPIPTHKEFAVPNSLKIDYEPFPKQDEFHCSTARYRLFGGAAGPGKSTAVLYEAAAQVMEHPNVPVHGILFRRTFPELESTLIRKAQAELPKKMWKYHSQKRLLVYKPSGGTIKFGYCQNEKDVYNYLGTEYDFIGIDELTTFTEFQFLMLVSRLRTVKPGIYPNFFGATNPGSVGHLWVKRFWIDRVNYPQGFEPEDFEYVGATVYDNPVLMQRDPEYIRRLEALPPTQRRAYLYGDWNIFQGQFFSEWVESVHVIDPFLPPAEWKRFTATDYGSSNPLSTHWYALNPNTDAPPEGRPELKGVKIVAYKEYYYPFPDPQTREMTPPQRDSDAAKALAQLSEGERIEYRVGDPSMWGKAKTKEDIATTFAQNGWPMTPADNDRKTGWSRIREVLKFQEAVPGKHEGTVPLLKVTRNCYHLIRTLPALIHDDKNVEEIADGQEDHAPDDLRYAVKSVSLEIKPAKPQNTARRNSMRKRFDPYSTTSY